MISRSLEPRTGGDRDWYWVSLCEDFGIYVASKEGDQIWAEPEGMLVTFHVFTAALIKGGCVWNHAVAPGARSDVRTTTKARPGSRVCAAEETTQI